MKLRPLPLALFALSALLRAQSADEYIHLRHQNHITKVVSQDALDALVGSKICEIDGTVKGTYKVGTCPIIQLERPDGTSTAVEADVLPEWIEGNEVSVRMIVRATRELEGGPITFHALGLATEATALRDVQPVAPVAKPKPKDTTARISGFIPASRAGTRTRNWVLSDSDATPYYADFILRQNPKLSTAEATRIARSVITFSNHYKVDARLVMAVISVESDFDPHSTSKHGAMGLTQLMPSTAQWMGVQNAYDSADSVYGCVKLLRQHFNQYMGQTGDRTNALILSLAAYNAGEGAVKRHGGTVPPYRETQAYVRLVIKKYLAYCGRA